jgi:hypothetical protein
MNALKRLGRGLLLVLIVASSIPIAGAVLGVVAEFRHAATDPERFGTLVGRLIGSLLVLAVCIWAFRKLRIPQNISQ